MADIKLREVKKGTIKTLNRAAIGAEKIKNVQAKTKELSKSHERNDSDSPHAYASDNISKGSKAIFNKAAGKTELIGRKSVAETKKNIIKMRKKKA